MKDTCRAASRLPSNDEKISEKIELLKSCFREAEEANDNETRQFCLLELGSSYHRISDFDRALEYYGRFYEEQKNVPNQPVETNVLFKKIDRLQEKIKGSNEKENTLYLLKKAVENIRLGLTITDTTGQIVYTNPADARMHGYEASELIGKHARVFSPPAQHRKMTPDEIKRKEQWRRESKNLRKNGDIFDVQLISANIKDESGHTIGNVTICEDISERAHARKLLNTTLKKTEQQKERAEADSKMKTDIIGIAAHDLKNPLTAIKLIAEVIHTMADTGSPIVEAADEIADVSQRMFQLIDNLLKSTALESGKLRLNSENVPMEFVIREVVVANRTRADQKEQGLSCEVEENCLVKGDPTWLYEIVDNLVGNSIKFSPIGRPISVKVAREGSMIRMEVIDKGLGLTDADKKLLFGKFQRLSAIPTGNESSSGLGLSIVKQLVELHQGKIWAESPGENMGATFIVELPAL